ncbi:MAG: nucleotidyltransferase family protein [Eggerthellaceae bacterium]|nr:nucleotidyltransferase family protein [Eggerthellaceae bacterium]
MGTDPETEAAVPQEVGDLLYLCGRALRSEPALPSRICKMNLAGVHALAASQNLSALSWYGMESAIDEPSLPANLAAFWRNERDKAARRQMLFETERDQILSWFEQNGIWYALLKGAVLAQWYPHLGMREFSDNDLLFDTTRRADVARFFKRRGYVKNASDHESTIVDTYIKKPIFNFEMHLRLFSPYSSQVLASHYDTIESKLVRKSDSPYALQLPPEDFYVYLIAHAYKHFQSGGTGVRILCDLIVFFDHEYAEMDWDYVDSELEALGLKPFEASLANLASLVFDAEFDVLKLDRDDAKVLGALTSYGIYGTVDHQAELRVERTTQKGVSPTAYVLSRLFPDDDWWDAFFPFAARHRWARAPMLLFRSVRAAVHPARRKRFAAELKALAKTDATIATARRSSASRTADALSYHLPGNAAFREVFTRETSSENVRIT